MITVLIFKDGKWITIKGDPQQTINEAIKENIKIMEKNIITLLIHFLILFPFLAILLFFQSQNWIFSIIPLLLSLYLYKFNSLFYEKVKNKDD